MQAGMHNPLSKVTFFSGTIFQAADKLGHPTVTPEVLMPFPIKTLAFVVVLFTNALANAQPQGTAKPELVLNEMVSGMPILERQAVRVLTANFKPGDQTVFHTHRSPVTVYILEGAFTLELEGRPPVIVKAGQAFVEPPNVKMTGYNRSSTDPLRLVIFYVSEPDTPFLDILQ
jgi:quercetin dioxygenase-like cupin family protein